MALSLQDRLDQAEAAYHDLMIGKSAKVFVDQNGERVEFTMADAVNLRRYVEALRAEVAGTQAFIPPMGVYF
jgi:hypothetical protein